MPPKRPIDLRVGGQTYRVVAGSENDPQLQRLAELVDRKHAEVVPPGRGMPTHQAMFLTAMALAQELEDQRALSVRLERERDRSRDLAARARDVVSRLLHRVDQALTGHPAAAAEAPARSTSAPPPDPDPALDPLTTRPTPSTSPS
ncbi:MAG: cell division protein ZapA [Polyangiaceae bacterium]